MNEPIRKKYIVSIEPPYSGRHGWTPCMSWCRETIGPSHVDTIRHNETWELTWAYVGEGVFEFYSEQNAMMFKLKWEGQQ